ncbi:hypothetical protein [Polyangium aurulentum]|uniref:hypothetical protein n=1 Tax=Polyangium aurulentum TaxID=2567896 RepID=UPI0010AED09E|nr:hypothetical protein [Polyangium aurulentum]UQA55435.1 hypothetical protein E8A73_029305 [Polyangium aurulentum]
MVTRSMTEEAFFAAVEPLPPGMLRATIRPHRGAEIAAALGAVPVSGAPGRFHTSFEGGDVRIADGHPFRGADRTFVWAPDARVIARALAAAQCDGAAANVEVADRLDEPRPPREAPPLPSAVELRTRGALPLLSNAPGQAGYVWARDDGVIEQIRVFDGRVIGAEEIQGATSIAFDYASPIEVLREVLSPRAVAVLSALDPRRDWDATCPRDALAARLAEAGLPASEAILGFEARCGGLHLGGASFGAAAHMHDRRAPGLVTVGRDGYHTRLAMDAGGAIHFVDTEVYEHPIPIAVAWTTFFERFHWERSVPESRSFLVPGLLGEAIARALGAPLVPEATDAYAALWFREGAIVHQIGADPGDDAGPTTGVAVVSLDDLVAALQAAQQEQPNFVLRWTAAEPGPSGRAAEERPILRVPLWEVAAPPRRELRVHGRPGGYWLAIGALSAPPHTART